MLEKIFLLEELLDRKAKNKIKNFSPYDWQREFYAAGKTNLQRMLMAANRVGKTYSAAYEVAFHLTGQYPPDWEGLKFAFPIRAWALGVTGEQIRDVVQDNLVGQLVGEELSGTGAIPENCIDHTSIVRSANTRLQVKDVRIKHTSGGYSALSFKAYSQGQHVLMGQGIDLIWIDEEPEDQDIYPQCLTRTATGNRGKGGMVIMTMTPENGMTPMVCQFMEDLKPGQYLQNVTWDDAPHLDEGVKEQLLGAYPEYQRDMRSKGIPVLGSGVIYPVSDESITCEPFEIPDHFHVLDATDFGWDHPQAHVQLWIDRDQDILYVARAWRAKEKDADQAWTKTKQWSAKVPTAWPHDGHQHEKGGGKELQLDYKKAGFDMMGSHATWATGGLSVESGLWQILQQMRDGRFKIFSTLTEVFDEKRLYHRDDMGRIVKVRDDLLSAIRYGYMMQRNAIPWAAVLELRRGDGLGGSIAVDFDPYAE